MHGSHPIRIDQTVMGPKGNCFSACLAMMLGLPIAEVPNFCEAPGFDEDPGEAFTKAMKEWLAERGWGHIAVDAPGRWFNRNFPRGYLIVAGLTSRGMLHSVVYKDGELWHDPHPSHEGIIEPKEVDLIFPLVPCRPKAEDRVGKQEAVERAMDEFHDACLEFGSDSVYGAPLQQAEAKVKWKREVLQAAIEAAALPVEEPRPVEAGPTKHRGAILSDRLATATEAILDHCLEMEKAGTLATNAEMNARYQVARECIKQLRDLDIDARPLEEGKAPDPAKLRRTVLAVLWEWGPGTGRDGARFWGCHDEEKDGRYGEWPKMGLRPLGASRVTVTEGDGLDLIPQPPAKSGEEGKAVDRG